MIKPWRRDVRRRSRAVAVSLSVTVVATSIALPALAASARVAAPSRAAGVVAADQDDPPAAGAALGSRSRPAASCWEIKQKRPDAPSGTYWLWTPKLVAAGQFYCDQERDGGGWVMLGRGRTGWTQDDLGQGSADEVHQQVTGPGAFEPRTLPAKMIDGLFNGRSADAQPMRLRRALDGAGTTWQETRYRYAPTAQHKMPAWSWKLAMGSRIPLSDVTFDGKTAGGGTTVRFYGAAQQVTSIWTQVDTYTYNVGTWSYYKTTPQPGASVSPDSYVYFGGNGRLNAPFTQMFARPELSSSDFAAVPETGLAEEHNKAVVRSGSLKNRWGVTGRSPKFQDNLDVEVQDFAEGDGVMYVGGNFTTVQRDKAGTDATKQEFLAAFDSKTSEWIPGFRPQLDGQVKAIKALPGGRLAVGGEFTTADGEPHEGFVVLDAKTGRVHEETTTELVNRVSTESVSVWDFEIDGDWLYLGGKFTHASKPGAREVYSRNLMRMSLDTLTPDREFTAELNGGAVDLDTHKGRLYAAGTFSLNKGERAFRALVIDLATLTQVPWEIHVNANTNVGASRQEAVVATDTSVWLTGSENLIAAYDIKDLSLKQTWLQHVGGDGQTIATNGDTVFAGCHCWNYTYEGGSLYGAREEISAIGAYDAVEMTTQRSPRVWDPVLSSRRGDGAWASLVDSNGTLWVGGDLTHAQPHGWTSRRWTGAFVRFEQENDSAAPVTPTGVTAVSDGTWDALSWDAAGEKGVTYQVFRIGDGAMVAQSTDPAVTVPAKAGARYVVRTVDEAGNASASSDPVAPGAGEVSPEQIPDGEQADPVQVVTSRSAWDYSFGAGTPEGWPAVTGLESSGPAPLGWGTGDVATEVPAAEDGKRPLASYYARSFDVPAEATGRDLDVTVRVDDGTAVYLNGTEILRENLPDGDLSDRTYASANVPSRTAPDNTVTVRVPAESLKEGTNVLTAEVHSNWSKAPSSTFDLEAVLR